MTPRQALLALFAFVVAVAALIGGATGLAYGLAFLAALVPGWPVGRALFGRGHAVGWICGSLIGYGLTALALWVPIALRTPHWAAFLLAWVATTVVTTMVCGRQRTPLVTLPAWTPSATRALALVLALVPAIMVFPYRHVGQIDEQGGRRYRAYFTADFVWHEALTAELARFDSPPRNPYMAAEPLHYYWGYFVLPSVVTGTLQSKGTASAIEPLLAVNALGAGLLFAGVIFSAAWAAFPRPWAVAAAVTLTIVAASAEGAYEMFDLWRRGLPLSQTRMLNIDAITAWFFYGLTFDGLPRALWWGPQHASASALGLVALIVAGQMGPQITVAATAGAGTALALALLMSPFPAGTMALTYGLALVWSTAAVPRQLPRLIATQLVAVGCVAVGLAWCLFNATFEGAGGAVTIGLSRAAIRTPLTILGLALGPVLLPAIAGALILAWRRCPVATRPALTGVTISGLLFFFVTLVLEPIWIGWRAGQQFLVTVPALVAAALAALHDRGGRALAAAGFVLLLGVGLPTTVIDINNAQDTGNLAMGPGFRWTVRLSPGEQEALRWIDEHTPPDALVQMSLEPRGRETWSLIPSFARRRMAAGLPISLLRTPEYDALAARADGIFRATDGAEASAIARALNIDYVYVGRVEREAFKAPGLALTDRADLFGRVFGNDDAAVYAVY